MTKRILLPGLLLLSAAALLSCEREMEAPTGNTVTITNKTQGYSFDDGEKESGFFESDRCQELFYALWEVFAARWGALSDRVVFELLNEVTEERYLPAWKRISRECVRRIRQHAPDTLILLGSYNWNSARTLPALDPPYDDRVLYNFHCYEPHTFTHQGAYWAEQFRDVRCSYDESGASEAFFEDFLAPALEKAEKEHCELYCGEYGVIDKARPEDAATCTPSSSATASPAACGATSRWISA